MASTLATILMAAIVVPGDVPEKRPAEMVRELDLSGEWEGTWESRDVIRAEMKHGIIRASGKLEDRLCGRCQVIFASESLVKVDYEGRAFQGIYKLDGERLLICIGPTSEKRPVSYKAGGGEKYLFIFRRVKSHE